MSATLAAERMARIVRLSMEAHACASLCAAGKDCGCRTLAKRVVQNFRFSKMPAGPGRPKAWDAKREATMRELLAQKPRLTEAEIAQRMFLTPAALRYRINAAGIKRGRWQKTWARRRRDAAAFAIPVIVEAWESVQ